MGATAKIAAALSAAAAAIFSQVALFSETPINRTRISGDRSRIRKPPLLFWTYAAVFEVAGKYNWIALHTVALLWTLGTMAGLYIIGRGMFDRETGLVAALLYSVFQPWAADCWQSITNRWREPRKVLSIGFVSLVLMSAGAGGGSL